MTVGPREVLVTGGGRGIGRAVALRFAEAGTRVFVGFFVNRDAAEDTGREIERRGGRAHLLQADLKDPVDVQRMFAEINGVADHLDVFVHNAASGVLRDSLELTAKHWDWVLSTNARPLLLCAREAVPRMPAGGRIIALTSLGSQRTIPRYAAVGVSKAAVEAFTRYLAVELAGRGITVNSVAPGAVDTDVWQAVPEGKALLDSVRARTPGGELVTPEDVAAVVFFLASEAARSIQGQVVVVDRGYSLLA